MLHLFGTFFFGALLGFHSFAQDFFSCSEQGLLLVMLLGLLTAVTSLLAECGLSTRGLSSSARSLRSMWDLPGPGLEPKSPALQVGILTHRATREVPRCALLFLI